LLCKVCNEKVAAEKCFYHTITYIKRQTYKWSKTKRTNSRKKKNMSQSFIANISGHTNRSEYILDLTRSFLSCNIPLSKLNNFKLRSFLKNILNGQEGA
jgi:hypothetical protein